jgi:hypothetical protein
MKEMKEHILWNNENKTKELRNLIQINNESVDAQDVNFARKYIFTLLT